MIGQARAIASRPSRSWLPRRAACDQHRAVSQDPERRQARGAGQAAAREGARMECERLVRAVRLHPEVAAGDHGPQGHQAAAQRLGQGQDVGLDPVALDGEQRPGPPQAGLHLVGDEERAGLAAEPVGLGQIPRRRRDHPPFPLDRLDHERGVLTRGQGQLEGLRVAVGDRLAVGDQRPEWSLIGPVAGDREGPEGLAVERAQAREQAAAAGRRPRQLQGGFDRLGPAVGEEDDLQAARGDGDQLLGQRGGQGVDRPRRESGCLLAHGRGDRRDHLGVVVPQVERAEARHEVEVGPPRLVEQLRPLAPDERAGQPARAAHADQDRVDVPRMPLGRVLGQAGEVDRVGVDAIVSLAVGRRHGIGAIGCDRAGRVFESTLRN